MRPDSWVIGPGYQGRAKGSLQAVACSLADYHARMQSSSLGRIFVYRLCGAREETRLPVYDADCRLAQRVWIDHGDRSSPRLLTCFQMPDASPPAISPSAMAD